MDEAVRRAMQRWPNAPAMFGWLQLYRRGNRLVKTTDGKLEIGVLLYHPRLVVVMQVWRL